MFRFDPTGGGLLGAHCVRFHSARYIRFTFPTHLHFSVALPLPPFLYLFPVSSQGQGPESALPTAESSARDTEEVRICCMSEYFCL